MRGRTPKPTALKLLEGGRGAKAPAKRRARQPKPPAPSVLDAPDGMRPAAAAEWKRIAADLAKVGLLTTVDRAALEVYCECWATFVDAREIVEEEGYISHGERGSTKNPAVQIMRDAAAMIRAFATEFGLTPAARGRMIMPAVDDEKEARSLLS